jgi:hypothetical protein
MKKSFKKASTKESFRKASRKAFKNVRNFELSMLLNSLKAIKLHLKPISDLKRFPQHLVCNEIYFNRDLLKPFFNISEALKSFTGFMQVFATNKNRRVKTIKTRPD